MSEICNPLDLATSVLKKPKLPQSVCKVSLHCMFIILQFVVYHT